MFVLLLTFLLIFPARALADTTVKISLIGDYFDSESNLKVKIEIGPSGRTSLKIRPRIEPYQTLFIYAGDAIFSLGSFWTDLPSVPDKLTLHTPLPFEAANLWFEVLDTETGKVYTTARKQVFGRGFAEAYINDLNRMLFGEQ